MEETPLDVDKRVMAVNYFGPVALAKGLLGANPRFSPSPPPLPATATAGAAATTTGQASSAGERAGAKPGSESEGGVRFVVINSVQGKFGMAFRSSYAASKHALVGFFDCFRAEHAHRGVGVLNVFPGYVRTRFVCSTAAVVVVEWLPLCVPGSLSPGCFFSSAGRTLSPH